MNFCSLKKYGATFNDFTGEGDSIISCFFKNIDCFEDHHFLELILDSKQVHVKNIEKFNTGIGEICGEYMPYTKDK